MNNPMKKTVLDMGKVPKGYKNLERDLMMNMTHSNQFKIHAMDMSGMKTLKIKRNDDIDNQPLETFAPLSVNPRERDNLDETLDSKIVSHRNLTGRHIDESNEQRRSRIFNMTQDSSRS